MIKRGLLWLPLFFLLGLLLSSPSHAAASSFVKANVEYGQFKSLFSMKDPVMIKDGRVLLPLREIGDILGLKVHWNQPQQRASLYGVNLELTLQLGSDVVYLNKKQKKLKTSAEVINGKLYIPLRFVAEAVNEDVKWNSNTKTLSVGSNYVVGTDKGITFWLNRKNGEFYQAIGNKVPSFIGTLEIRGGELRHLQVQRLSDNSSYVRLYEAEGMSELGKRSGQIFVKNGQIIREAHFEFIGHYPDTNAYNLYDLRDKVLFSDGKHAEFLNHEGEVVAYYNLGELTGKEDEIYMIEYITDYYMILREYGTQHLILYHRMREITAYVHELLPLPPAEKQFLEEVALDRNNEPDRELIIRFNKQEENTLLFLNKSKKTGQVHSYPFNLTKLKNESP
ncbi:copper amine oxidase N-terminal domain-containing protein [Paenibacillus glucanolyticus]|nr:copper amine oxidase N-terminal domain-containing protein [Paenibacillus glucanolyticus]ETT33310.1 copper amine oxidase domain-containing protein [Paenibacillus sp. FSL R5-808]